METDENVVRSNGENEPLIFLLSWNVSAKEATI